MDRGPPKGFVTHDVGDTEVGRTMEIAAPRSRRSAHGECSMLTLCLRYQIIRPFFIKRYIHRRVYVCVYSMVTRSSSNVNLA